MLFWRIDPFVIVQYPPLFLMIFLALKSTLSEINATFLFSFVSVSGGCLSPSFAFTLCVSLHRQRASCGHRTLLGIVFWFTDNLYFLIGNFRTLTFKAIVGLVSTTFVFCLLLLFFVFIFILYSFSSFCGFNYFDSIFSPFLTYPLYLVLFCFSLFNGCPRLCNVLL